MFLAELKRFFFFKGLICEHKNALLIANSVFAF